MTLLQVVPSEEPEVDLTKTYDAIVVGSGAAGGMAAHVLTSQGLKVLLLEAGRKINIEEELRSTEWPYENPRRGEIPPQYHGLGRNEYTIRKPPYAKDSIYEKVFSYVGGWRTGDYTKNILVNEKDHPYTGTPFAWVRARVLGGKTTVWGRLALRFSDLDFKAASRDGFGDDWPILYKDIEPYYDRVDRYLGISGHAEHLPHLPDSLFQRSVRLTDSEVHLRRTLDDMGRVLTPYRAGVTTDGLKHNKYRSRCYGRGACFRRAGGCDIHAAFDSPTGLIYPAMDTGNLTLRTNATAYEVTVDTTTGKASGVGFIDSTTKKSYQVKAKAVVLAASTLESTRLLLLSRSPQHPNGIGNSSGHVGHNFCEHVMGGGGSAFVKERVGKARTLDDGRPGAFYVPRFRNLTDKNPNFLRGYGFEGDSGIGMYPSTGHVQGFGSAYKKQVRDTAGAFINLGGFGEVLPRFENHVSLNPTVKDRWGIPVLNFDIKMSDNEQKMIADMGESAREMLDAAGFEVRGSGGRALPSGWSIHELGTARMGNDPKTSVVNGFEQSHDVKNLFVVDGAPFVSASCQNPTWTIMALAWRSCDYLASEMKKGNL